MAKAQIIVEVDQPDEVRALAMWFERWRDRLASVSDNTGCGCCVDIWDVEGPAEALAELPEAVVAHPGVYG
ncbi:MAG: hypothetical protein QM703_10485 [Gemmatales bacterium]